MKLKNLAIFTLIATVATFAVRFIICGAPLSTETEIVWSQNITWQLPLLPWLDIFTIPLAWAALGWLTNYLWRYYKDTKDSYFAKFFVDEFVTMFGFLYTTGIIIGIGVSFAIPQTEIGTIILISGSASMMMFVFCIAAALDDSVMDWMISCLIGTATYALSLGLFYSFSHNATVGLLTGLLSAAFSQLVFHSVFWLFAGIFMFMFIGPFRLLDMAWTKISGLKKANAES